MKPPTGMELLAALDVLRRFFVDCPTVETADPWVDAAQAEIPQRTIRNAVRGGALAASRIGGKLLVRRSALDAFIAGARVRSSMEPSAALTKLGAKRRAA